MSLEFVAKQENRNAGIRQYIKSKINRCCDCGFRIVPGHPGNAAEGYQEETPEITLSVTVPWPLTDPERALSITALKAELSSVNPLTDDQVDRLARMASDKIQGYAPDAPDASKEISLLRYISYMVSMTSGAITKLTVGSTNMEFRHSTSNAWINSGAAAVVVAYRKHTAGLIGTGTDTSSDDEETLSMRQQFPNVDITEVPKNIGDNLDRWSV